MGNAQGTIADGQLAAALQQGDVAPLLQQLHHHNRKIVRRPLVERSGDTAVHILAKNGTVTALKEVLAAELEIRQREKNRQLTRSEIKHYSEKLLNVVNYKGRTPFMAAAKAGHTDMMQYLKDHHADMWLKDKMGATAAHHAASGGQEAVLTWLHAQERQAHPHGSGSRSQPLPRLDEGDFNGMTPLFYAIFQKRHKVVSQLCELGASIYSATSMPCTCDVPATQCNAGCTPLHAAALTGSTRTAKALMKAYAALVGAAVDAGGRPQAAAGTTGNASADATQGAAAGSGGTNGNAGGAAAGGATAHRGAARSRGGSVASGASTPGMPPDPRLIEDRMGHLPFVIALQHNQLRVLPLLHPLTALEDMFAEERPEDRVVGVPRLVEIAAQVAQRVLMAQLEEVEPLLPAPGLSTAPSALARAVSLSQRSGNLPGSPVVYTPPRSPVPAQQHRRSPVPSGAVQAQQGGPSTPTRSSTDRLSAPSPFMTQQQPNLQQHFPGGQPQQQLPSLSKSMLLKQALLAGASPPGNNSWINRRGAWRATLERHGLSLHPGHSHGRQAPSRSAPQGSQQQLAGAGGAAAGLPPLPRPPSDSRLTLSPSNKPANIPNSQAPPGRQASILDNVARPNIGSTSTGADWIRRRSAWREQLVRHQAQLLAGEKALAVVHNLGAAAKVAAAGQRSRPQQLGSKGQGPLRHSVTAQSLAELRSLMGPSLTGAATDDFSSVPVPPASTTPQAAQQAIPTVPSPAPAKSPAAPGAPAASISAAAAPPAPGGQATGEATAGQLLAPSTAHCLRLLGLQSLVGAPAADILRSRSLAARSTSNMFLPASSLHHGHVVEQDGEGEEEPEVLQPAQTIAEAKVPSDEQSDKQQSAQSQQVSSPVQGVPATTSSTQMSETPPHLTHTSSENDVSGSHSQPSEGPQAFTGAAEAGLNRVLTPQPASQRWEDQINAAISMLRMHRLTHGVVDEEHLGDLDAHEGEGSVQGSQLLQLDPEGITPVATRGNSITGPVLSHVRVVMERPGSVSLSGRIPSITGLSLGRNSAAGSAAGIDEQPEGQIVVGRDTLATAPPSPVPTPPPFIMGAADFSILGGQQPSQGGDPQTATQPIPFPAVSSTLTPFGTQPRSRPSSQSGTPPQQQQLHALVAAGVAASLSRAQSSRRSTAARSAAGAPAPSEGWEDACGVCLDTGHFVSLHPCGHHLCVVCTRELLRLHDLKPALCPFDRRVITGISVPGAKPPQVGDKVRAAAATAATVH